MDSPSSKRPIIRRRTPRGWRFSRLSSYALSTYTGPVDRDPASPTYTGLRRADGVALGPEVPCAFCGEPVDVSDYDSDDWVTVAFDHSSAGHTDCKDFHCG